MLEITSFAIAFLLFNTVGLLLLPRRWAALPLIIGACYMTLGQGIVVGPFHFSVLRLLIGAGFVRIALRGEWRSGAWNQMDWLMLSWGGWLLTSALFHKDIEAAFIYRLGLFYNACGLYYLLRVFCQSIQDVVYLCIFTAILLIPVAVEMIWETLNLHNLFSIFGGVPENPIIRLGKIRAQGPFAHPILAGTIGAVCLPMMIGLWKQYRRIAIAGGAACILMIYASASSGPIMSAVVGIVGIFMWLFRQNMRLLRWLLAGLYVGLELLMNAPVYFLLARVDISGGSTGWHRAQLIQSAFQHISEWWFAGTDYTRHWMPTGVYWSADHADITNHYLNLGVIGGLPLMILFIIILIKGFAYVGETISQGAELPPKYLFLVWALGASLFAHAATFISVSYFDQSILFLYLTLAGIGSAWSDTKNRQKIS